MHETWLSQLPYYVAGTLDPDEREALEAHVRGCEPCRAALETWMVIAGAVRADASERVDTLPPLRQPGAFSRNGHAEDPSFLDATIPQTRQNTEGIPMTVHYPEITRLRPAPQSRALLTTAVAMLLIVVLGAGAVLLAGRVGDPGAPGASGPGGEQPAGLGAQAETPTLPPTSTDTPVPLTSPTALHPSSAQMTATALIDNATALAQVTPTLVPTIPPTGTPILVGPGTMLPPTVAPPLGPGMSSSISAVPLDAGLPPRAEIEGVRFEAQTWNNSGPAALAMALSALGWEGDQADAAEWLRADSEDRSVMLWEMVLFVEQETDYGALHRVGGVPALLKRLVAYGFPVVIPVGFEAEEGEWYGHHWVVTGYDDEAQTFLVYDSYLGAGEDGPREVSYDELDDAWRQFNRAFLIVYRPEDRAEALDELAHYADPAAGHQAALQLALDEGVGDDVNAWTAFNIGAAWAALGDYVTASQALDKAFELGLPWRTLWYRPEPYVAYYGAGNFEAVMRLADEQSQVAFFEEAAYWRGMVYAAQGLTDLARREFQSVLDANPNYLLAQVALGELALAELDIRVFPAGNRSIVFDPTLYTIVESQGVAPTPVMRGEQAIPPVQVTLSEDQVPQRDTGAPFIVTATPIPAQ